LKIGNQLLLSTGEPALRSLHDIWSTPVAFLIFILLTSLVIVSVFVGLKSKSMSNHFCQKKSTGGQQKIVLMENDVILNDKKDVCDTFNSFFINVKILTIDLYYYYEYVNMHLVCTYNMARYYFHIVILSLFQ
jgi:hypothetical protein